MFGDVLDDHFPPRLTFVSPRDRANWKSRLILEARARADNGDVGAAVLLYNQAAMHESVLAAEVSAPNARRVSAATCWGLAGDLQRARKQFAKLKRALDDDARSFVRTLERKRRRESRAALEMKAAFEREDLRAVLVAQRHGIGLLPVRVLYWPEYRLLERSGAWERAAIPLRKLIVAMPDRATFHLLYAALLRDSVLERARDYCEYALRGFPGDLRMRVTQASVELALQHYDAANKIAADIISAPGDLAATAQSFLALAYIVRAASLRRQGHAAAALDVIVSATTTLPVDAGIATMRGLLLLAEQKQHLAIAAFRNAVVLEQVHNRRTAWPAMFGGALALELGDLKEAGPLLEQAITHSHGLTRAKNLTNLGVLRALQGGAALAAQAFEAALAIAPLPSAQHNLDLLAKRASTLEIETLEEERNTFEFAWRPDEANPLELAS